MATRWMVTYRKREDGTWGERVVEVLTAEELRVFLPLVKPRGDIDLIKLEKIDVAEPGK